MLASVITLVIIFLYVKYLTIGEEVYYKLNKKVEDTSIVISVEDPSKLVRTVGDTSKPVTTVEDTSVPVTTTEDISVPFTTTEDTSLDTSNEDAHKIASNLKHARFAICTTFWEQQTNALLNMWSFLKWAKFTGFRVFEPFAHHSVFEFSNEVIGNYNTSKILHFGDYFDLNLWTTLMQKHGLPPFEKWDAFALSPLKRTVLVFLVYNSGHGGGFVDDDINNHQLCKHRKEFFYNRFAKFFDRLQIQVVREVCIAFGSFTLHRFNSLFLLNNDTHVWFTEWRGIESGRMSITDHRELHRTSNGLDNILAMAKESPRVMKDAKNYVNTILNTDFRKYTAVAFRATTKKNVLAAGHSREYVMQYLRDCAEQVERELLKNPSSIKFLSIDLGRLGDLTSNWYFEINNDGNKLFQFILNKVYGNKTIDEYENELIRGANGIDDSGYIGSMVKNIAENAGKLIVVGGHSNFQRSILMHFQANNGNCQDCVVRICY